MTPGDLRTLGPTLFATEDHWRWQTLLADEIGVAPRTVRRWLDGTRKISETTSQHIRSRASLRKK